MERIHCRSTVSSSMLQHVRHRSSASTDKLLWLSNFQPSSATLLRLQTLPSLPLRTQALPASSPLSGLTSSLPPAGSTDIAVFVLVSALFFTLFWIANFVVPDILAGKLQSMDTNEEQVLKEDNKSAKKQGFGQEKNL